MVESISLSLQSFRPEMTLIVSFVVAMITEFLFGKRHQVAAWVVLLGFIIAMLQLPAMMAAKQAFLFGTMYINDPYSVFFKFLILITSSWIVLFSLHSKELQKEREHTGEYFVLLSGATVGLVLLTSASNLLMMYLALELSSISSYVLAGFSKTLKRSSEAALKYVIYGAVSSGIMLYGISILFGLTGSLDLVTIHDQLMQGAAVSSAWTLGALISAIVLMLAGFGYKISAVPFHFWTPDVYEGAPVPVTAFLSVASKAAGFAVMVRFFFMTFVDTGTGQGSWTAIQGINWNIIVAVIAVLTMTVGNFIAVWQNNLKRMLAYSSIAHAGYMLMGVVVMSSSGMSAVIIYFMMYCFMNLGAFYIVQVVADELGSEDIDAFRGLGRRSPWIAAAFAIFLVSLTGLPPTAGFIGKFYLFTSLLDPAMGTTWVWLAIVGALNSVVSLYYYARVLRSMYLRQAPEGADGPVKFNASVIVNAVIFIIPNILFGLYFQPIVSFAHRAAVMFMGR
jgi:NADH-quinone oxidoreductase subunit N